MAHAFTATTTAATLTQTQFLDRRFTQIHIQNRGSVGLFVGFNEVATVNKFYIAAGETHVSPNVDTTTLSILAESATVPVVIQTF